MGWAGEVKIHALRRRWLAIAVMGLIVILATGAAPGDRGWLPPGWPWLSATVWALIMVRSGTDLVLHAHPLTGNLLNRLGPGTWLTLLRAACLAALAGFLLQPRPAGFGGWLPAILYTVSDFADYADGYLARRSGTASEFGRRFDLELDALGLLLAVGLAIGYRVLPWWFLPIGLARYAFAGLIWLRNRAGRRVHPLPVSLARRPLAGLMMGYLSVVLWPIIDSTALTIAGVMFAIPFSLGFVRDGLTVNGTISPADPDYQRWRGILRITLLTIAPLAFRLGLVAFAVREIPRLMSPTSELVFGLRTMGLDRGGLMPATFAALIALGVVATSVGWAGRLAAFTLLFPLGLTTAAVGTDQVRALGLVSTLAILMVGTGLFSLWQPSDDLFRRRAGETEDGSNSD
jgi:CDP-diacylglycerol--glycerol-3-phosphate 3-phosphatidyltransferase